MRLKDKVALLTAAAGAGIGQATARTMAREGAKFVVTDAHTKRPFAMAEAIEKDFGVETLGMQCDVTAREQIELVVKASLDRLARIYPEDEIKRMHESIPYPRKGTPQDIANIALFLCSDEGEYVTGQTICATGGTWMH